jgi:hypothetical protein
VNGVQCDTCRVFAAGNGEGWLFLATLRPAASSLMSMIGGGGGAEIVGTFCSPRCLAEHAYVMAATGSPGSAA